MNLGRLYQIFGAFCVLCVFAYVWNACKGLKYRRILIAVLGAELLFIFIGYKHVSVPLITYMFIGGIGIPAIVYGVMFETDILLIVAATYLPFNLLLPADFGGTQKALNGTNIILVALFIGYLISGRKTSRLYPGSRLALWLIGVYVILSLVSYVRGSLFHGVSYLLAFLFPVKRWLTPAIVFYLFYKMIKSREIMFILFSILMLTVIMNIFFGVLEWVNLGFGTYSEFKRRLGGINMQPNFYGAFLAYYLGLLAGPFLTGFRSNTAKLLLFPFLLGLRIIIPTNSRGAWIAVPPALATLSFFRSKAVFGIFIFAALAMIFFPSLLPDTIQGRFGEALQRGEVSTALYDEPGPGAILSESKSISFRTRYRLLTAGLQLAKENPWFGLGWGVFPYRIGDYGEHLYRASAHNIWLQMLCEMGLLTVLALLLALIVLFGAAVYSYRRENAPLLRGMALGFMASIPAIIVANMTGNRFDAEELMFIFWIVSAMVLKLKGIIRAEQLEQTFTERRA